MDRLFSDPNGGLNLPFGDGFYRPFMAIQGWFADFIVLFDLAITQMKFSSKGLKVLKLTVSASEAHLFLLLFLEYVKLTIR